MSGRVVLFDLDGTLVDSLPGIAAGINRTLGTSLTHDEVRPRIGPPLEQTFGELTGLTGAALDAVVAEYRRIYAELMVETTVVYDGVAELLGELRARRLILGVATSKARPLAERLLAGLGLASSFAAIEGPVPGGRAAYDDKRTTVATALRSLGHPPVAAVTMVGDRHHDVEGAHALGIRVIGVTWGFGSAEELRDADALADEPGALATLLGC